MKILQELSFFIKAFFFISMAQFFLGCSSINFDRIAPSIGGAYDSIKGALFGYPDPIINREMINSIPYASSLLKIGKGSTGLIILESVNADKHTWVSKDNIYLEIKDGRIVKTDGLINNLTNLSIIDQSFEEILTKPQKVKNHLSYYSYDNPYLMDLEVNVSILIKGMQEVEILGEVKTLILIEESISNNEIRWHRKNLFWIDPKDYFVWKSVQHISPKLPSFTLQITKRPSR